MSLDRGTEPEHDQPTLRGIILRNEEQQLIVQAAPEEVRRFAPQRGQDVLIASRPRGVGPNMYFYGAAWADFTDDAPEPELDSAFPSVRPGETLFDRVGRPVAIIREVHVTPGESIDVTTFGNRQPLYIQGLGRVRIEADGIVR